MSSNTLPWAWACALTGVLGLYSPAALGNPGPAAEPPAATDWAAANRRVGELLRGHIDVVQWENRQAPAAAATAPAQTGPGGLSLDAALRAARLGRPELVAPPGLNAAERTRLQQAAAAHAHTVTQAWLDAVAAREALQHLAPVVNATEAATELARRMAAVGNWSAARAAAEELVWLGVQNQWTLAQQRARQAEHQLRQHLPPAAGATAEPPLPTSLPVLPGTDTPDAATAVAQALAKHPDWPLAEAEAQRRERGLSAQDRTRIAQVFEQAFNAAGPTDLAERPRGTPWPHGWGEAAETRARADALARQVRAHVALALDGVATTRTLVTRAERALALSQQQFDDMQLRYNGMLYSTWDLVAAGRARAQAAQALTQARHDAWRAHTDLQAVLAGLPYSGGPANTDTGASAAAPKGH